MSGKVIAFVAEIEKVRFQALICRFTGTDFYYWWWLTGSRGHLIHWNLTDPQHSGQFLALTDFHSSYHSSGQKHDRVTTQHAGAKLIPRQDAPLRDAQWKSIALISVPLEGPVGAQCVSGPWGEAGTVVVLRKLDFGNSIGLNLRLCVGEESIARQHAEDYRGCTWFVSVGNRALVIFAEKVPAPNS